MLGVANNVASPVAVAVLGSCVSRDLFNSRFNPHYKDLFDCVVLSNQTSLISLMSEPVDVPAERMADLDDYGRRELAREASRAVLAELVEKRPEYVLIDLFADVHFGCFAVDGRYLTRNRWKVMNTSFYAEAQRVDLLPEDRDAYLARWREAVDGFLAFMGRELPDTRLVLHRARNVTQSIGADGELHSLGRQRALRDMNEWWDVLDGELASRGIDRVLDVFRPDLTSFQAHPWGPFAVHYTLDYHAEALSKLTQIVLADARARVSRAEPVAGRAAAGRRGTRLVRAWQDLRRRPALTSR